MQKSQFKKYKKEIKWLLREKYNFSEIEISDFFSNCSRFTDNDSHLQKDIQRILDGEPVDYVIGFKEFLGCKIDLSLKPLIPRPETEFWVKEVLDRYPLSVTRLELSPRSTVPGSRITILDLCCGSGCIGIALLSTIPNANVTFADISDKALEQTRLNLQINNFPACAGKQFSNNFQGSNFQIIKSNLFQNLKGKKFDYIFCNPPYVRLKEIKGNLLYEPKIALDGKKDGLEIIYKILSEFQNYLNPNGKLFLEFGFGQKGRIEKKILETRDEKLEKTKFRYEFKKDQFNRYRYLMVKCIPNKVDF